MSETDDGNYNAEFDADYKTGWRVLTGNQSVVKMIDTLLDFPPHKEVTKTELAELAGVSRQSVHNHIELLVYIDVVEPVPDSSPQRYRFNHESEVSEAIIRLEGAMNRKGPNA